MNEIANEFNISFISIDHSLLEKNQSVHSSEEYLGQKAKSVYKFTTVNDTVLQAMTIFQIILIKHVRTVLIKPTRLFILVNFRNN